MKQTTNIFNLVSKLKTKKVYPKLYVFNLHYNAPTFGSKLDKLAICVNYRYEDALNDARTQFIEDIKKVGLPHVNVPLNVSTWDSYELMDLFNGFLEEDVKTIKNTNVILKTIKDYKNEFTNKEKQLIHDMIK